MAKERNPKYNASSAIIREVNSQRHALGKEGIGEFTESVGGGSPSSGGGRGAMHEGGKTQNPRNFVVADSPEDPKAIKAKAEGKDVRYMQPRTKDGQFTYNSANARKLYYGPSRGRTDLPFLDGVELRFFTEIDGVKQFDDEKSIIQAGAKFLTEDGKRIIMTINMTVEELKENLKHYIVDTHFVKKANGNVEKMKREGFAGLTTGSSVLAAKQGRRSNQEKEAMAEGRGFAGMQKSISDSTQERMDNAEDKWLQDQEKRVEKADFMPKPGSSSFGSKNFNTAGVNFSNIEELTNRDEWRKAIEAANAVNTRMNRRIKNGLFRPTEPIKETVPPQNNIDMNKEFDIQTIIANPKKFVMDNMEFFEKAKQKNPGIKNGQIINAIVKGLVKTPKDILEG